MHISSTFICFLTNFQKSVPIRPAAVHLVNAGSLIDLLVRLVKQFIPEKVANRVRKFPKSHTKFLLQDLFNTLKEWNATYADLCPLQATPASWTFASCNLAKIVGRRAGGWGGFPYRVTRQDSRTGGVLPETYHLYRINNYMGYCTFIS